MEYFAGLDAKSSWSGMCFRGPSNALIQWDGDGPRNPSSVRGRLPATSNRYLKGVRTGLELLRHSAR